MILGDSEFTYGNRLPAVWTRLQRWNKVIGYHDDMRGSKSGRLQRVVKKVNVPASDLRVE